MEAELDRGGICWNGTTQWTEGACVRINGESRDDVALLVERIENLAGGPDHDETAARGSSRTDHGEAAGVRVDGELGDGVDIADVCKVSRGLDHHHIGIVAAARHRALRT